MLSLVLPKGSLERATLELFDAADLTVRRSSDRDYHASIDDPRIDRVRFLRPQEIPSYIERGLFDLGITGRDWIAETEADVVSLGELQYSKATSQPVRVVLAVPDSAPWQSAADMPEGVRISTEFPSLTRRFLDTRGVKAMVIPSYGATEAKVPDIVDAIVDLTETGSSLRKNGLRILETLLTSYTELIASAPAFADADKRAAMEDIALLLRGAIQARGNVLLKLNVAADKLAAVTDMLPALSSPTITTLARGNMNAVETVVPKRGVNTLIPGPEGGRGPGHPGDPDQQDRGVAVPHREPDAGIRQTARVLPVDDEGRVLLLHGWDPHHPDRPFWFTIGGAADPGESLARGGCPRVVRGDPHLGRARAPRRADRGELHRVLLGRPPHRPGADLLRGRRRVRSGEPGGPGPVGAGHHRQVRLADGRRPRSRRAPRPSRHPRPDARRGGRRGDQELR